MQGICRSMQTQQLQSLRHCPWFLWKTREGSRSGGLGSSHTTPCGAAVPARPPTRSSETRDRSSGPQWVSGAMKEGTGVVVQRGYLWPKAKLLPPDKLLIISNMEKSTHRLLGFALPIVLIQFRSNLIQIVCCLSRTSSIRERSILSLQSLIFGARTSGRMWLFLEEGRSTTRRELLASRI
jgi:hypothetical protein